MRNVDAAGSDAGKGGGVVAITGAKAEAPAAEDANFSTTADGAEGAQAEVGAPPSGPRAV